MRLCIAALRKWLVVAAAATVAAVIAEASFTGCDRHSWMCNGGQCIPSAYLCDGELDCPGGEDEGSDVCGSCAPNSFYCASADRCLSYLFMCDGVANCPLIEDEPTDRCFDVPERKESVSCNATTISLRVFASTPDETAYTFGSACFLRNTGSMHEGTLPLDACGAFSRLDGSTVVRYIYLVTVATSAPGGSPNAAVVPPEAAESLRLVECRYKANVAKALAAAAIDPATAAAAIGSVDVRPPLSGSPASNVTGVVMRLYDSLAFDEPHNRSTFPIPLSAAAGGVAYVGVEALGEAQAVQLAIRRCQAYRIGSETPISATAAAQNRSVWSGGNSGRQAERQLVRDGCVTSKAFKFLPTPDSSQVRFAVRALAVAGSGSLLFLECEVGVCDKGNYLCGGGCRCAALSRTKRSPTVPFAQLYSVRFGPLAAP